MEEILSLSQGGKDFKKPEEKEKAGGNAVQYAKKEVQDIVLQMKKEGEKLDYTPMYSRDRKGTIASAKKALHFENLPEKKKLQEHNLTSDKRHEEWLDTEDDWLDE